MPDPRVLRADARHLQAQANRLRAAYRSTNDPEMLRQSRVFDEEARAALNTAADLDRARDINAGRRPDYDAAKHAAEEAERIRQARYGDR